MSRYVATVDADELKAVQRLVARAIELVAEASRDAPEAPVADLIVAARGMLKSATLRLGTMRRGDLRLADNLP